MTYLLAATVAGAGVGLGLSVLLAGILTAGGPARSRRGRPDRRRSRSPLSSRRAAVAMCAGLLAWLLSGWIVAGAIAAAAVVGLPSLLRPGLPAQQAIARLEACEEWARGLASRLAAGMTLEYAILASHDSAPQAIASEVGRLASRLRNAWDTPAALDAFADDLDDATGDLLTAGMKLAAQHRGAGLSEVLGELAASVADEVAMRRRIEADRARPRTTARLVSLIAVGTSAVLMSSGTYMAPYDSPLGQVVLAGIAAVFVAALAWMRSLGTSRAEPRFLVPAAAGRRRRSRRPT